MGGSCIDVAVPSAPTYKICIEPGVLADGWDGWEKAQGVVVTNTTLAALYSQQLADILPNTRLVTMPDGEQYKSLETVASLYAQFVEAELDRSSTVFAFGGGVVGDTAGFAAATYMRGVRLVQVPTTLLAMVDSSVGGKVGVDLPQGKNLVGAFKQPDYVLAPLSVLHTLPEREWRCGMAEIIKHGFLADPELLNPELWRIERAPELVRRAVQVKVDVVQRDPYEQNVRAHLNLGHTFAHAVEQVSGYSWLHGEAVGVGLVAAARLSYAMGLCDSGLPEEVEDIVSQIGLPTRLGGLEPEALYAAMSTDKKWQGGHSRFILLRGVGQPEIVHDVPKETVLNILEQLQ